MEELTSVAAHFQLPCLTSGLEPLRTPFPPRVVLPRLGRSSWHAELSVSGPPLKPPRPTQAPALRIGEISNRSGVSVKTIRFYCDQGLLEPSDRSEGGYRLFQADCLAELELIRALRAMDVPLAELKRILEARRSGICNCAALKASIVSKIESIDARIDKLLVSKAELADLLKMWRECGGTKPAS